MLESPQFWVDVFKIIMIDLLLSGDNAVVIALACRNLPQAQRRQGILYGVGGAIGLRVVLTFFAVSLLALPYLKIVGALLLLWIGIKLILPEEEGHGEGSIKAEANLWGAVKTIIIADFVMSLDNVLGVAAAAKGNVFLLVFGLLVSIPLIAWSSQLVLKLSTAIRSSFMRGVRSSAMWRAKCWSAKHCSRRWSKRGIICTGWCLSCVPCWCWCLPG